MMAAPLIDGDTGKRSNIAHHCHGDFRNGSVTWSTVAGVARPRMRCFFEVTRAR
jgi:hypothetical protein